MRSVLFVIAGFGGPKKVQEKIQWLHHNIKILNKNSVKQRIKMLIFCYDETIIPLPEELNFEIEIVRKKGFIYQFLYENVTPSYLIQNNFNYFHALMDDVELSEDYDLEEVLNFYENENCDIIQHSLKEGSVSNHMNDMKLIKEVYFTKSNHLEYFSYIMNFKNYKKYYNLLDEKTRCGWGLDVILPKYFNKLILLHRYPIGHYVTGDGYENVNFNMIEEYHNILNENKKITSIKNKCLLILQDYPNLRDIFLNFNFYFKNCKNISHYNVNNIYFSIILANISKNNGEINIYSKKINKEILYLQKEFILDDININLREFENFEYFDKSDLVFIETNDCILNLDFYNILFNSTNKYIVFNGDFDKNILNNYGEWKIEKKFESFNITILKHRFLNEKSPCSDFGFVISRNVSCEKTNEYWNECVSKIRDLYPQNKILIIDESDKPEFIKNKDSYDNLEIIQSEFKGSGEMSSYYYFYHNKPFEKAVILQDKTFIQQKISFEYTNDIIFLWSFEHYWDNPENEKKLIEKLNQSDLLIDFYNRKDSWKGCFGNMSIIDYNFLSNIQNKYNIFELIKHINNKSQQEHLERIFACICYYEIEGISSLFGDIHNFLNNGFKWGYSYEDYKNNQNSDKSPIIKIW